MKLFEYFFRKVKYRYDLFKVMFILFIFPSFFSAQDFSENVTGTTMHVAPGTVVFNANEEQSSITNQSEKVDDYTSVQVKNKKVLKTNINNEKVIAQKNKNLKEKKESIQHKVKIITFYTSGEDFAKLVHNGGFSHCFILSSSNSLNKKINNCSEIASNYFGQQKYFGNVSASLFVRYYFPHLQSKVDTLLFSRPPPSHLT